MRVRRMSIFQYLNGVSRNNLTYLFSCTCLLRNTLKCVVTPLREPEWLSRYSESYVLYVAGSRDVHSDQACSGAHLSPIQWILVVLSSGEEQLGRESDHLPMSATKVKMSGAILALLPSSHMPSWRAKGQLHFTIQVIRVWQCRCWATRSGCCGAERMLLNRKTPWKRNRP